MTSSWLFSDIDAQEFYDEPTVLRMLVSFKAYIRLAVGFNNALTWCQELRVGIILCRADFADPNVPQIMNLNDYSLDWLYFRVHMFHHQGGDVLAFPTLTHGGDQGFQDIRSKRKIPEGYGLAMVIQSADETNAPTDTLMEIAYDTEGRMLLADH